MVAPQGQEAPRGRATATTSMAATPPDNRLSAVAEASNSRSEGTDQDIESVGQKTAAAAGASQMSRGLDSGKFGRGQQGLMADHWSWPIEWRSFWWRLRT